VSRRHTVTFEVMVSCTVWRCSAGKGSTDLVIPEISFIQI